MEDVLDEDAISRKSPSFLYTTRQSSLKPKAGEAQVRRTTTRLTSSSSRSTSASDYVEELMRDAEGSWFTRNSVIPQKHDDHEYPEGSLGAQATKVLGSSSFDTIMGVVICFNVTLMIQEANLSAECDRGGGCTAPAHVVVLNVVFLCVYLCEVGLRVFVERCRFFSSCMNLVDVLVVCSGLLELTVLLVLSSSDFDDFPGFEILRVFRLLRLVRTAKLLRFSSSLATMVEGFFNVMTAMGWGMLMIALMLLVLAIVAVEIVTPNTVAFDQMDPSCDESFSSVGYACLILFQTLIAGDAWSDCLVPVIKQYWLYFALFGGAFCAVELGFMNLILSSVITVSADMHEQDMGARKLEFEQKKDRLTKDLVSVFKRIDKDNKGSITGEELIKAYEKDSKVNTVLTLCDIDEDDLRQLFDFMDVDNDERVDYKEFVTSIRRAMQQDVRMQLMTLKLQVAKVTRAVFDIRGILDPERPLSTKAARRAHTSLPHEPAAGPDAGRAAAQTPTAPKTPTLRRPGAARPPMLRGESRESEEEPPAGGAPAAAEGSAGAPGARRAPAPAAAACGGLARPERRAPGAEEPRRPPAAPPAAPMPAAPREAEGHRAELLRAELQERAQAAELRSQELEEALKQDQEQLAEALLRLRAAAAGASTLAPAPSGLGGGGCGQPRGAASQQGPDGAAAATVEPWRASTPGPRARAQSGGAALLAADEADTLPRRRSRRSPAPLAAAAAANNSSDSTLPTLAGTLRWAGGTSQGALGGTPEQWQIPPPQAAGGPPPPAAPAPGGGPGR